MCKHIKSVTWLTMIVYRRVERAAPLSQQGEKFSSLETLYGAAASTSKYTHLVVCWRARDSARREQIETGDAARSGLRVFVISCLSGKVHILSTLRSLDHDSYHISVDYCTSIHRHAAPRVVCMDS